LSVFFALFGGSDHIRYLASISFLSRSDGINATTGDKDGRLVLFQVTSGAFKAFTPLSNAVFTISFSPFTPQEVAVGYTYHILIYIALFCLKSDLFSYQNGSVLLINAETQQIIHRMTGHAEDIHAISWNYSPTRMPVSGTGRC
jgi:WD40 repeat protein